MTNINIGAIIDFRFNGEESTYSSEAYYAIEESLTKAFSGKANLFFLPHERASAEGYMDVLDALILTSSSYHIDPFYYNEAKKGDYITDNRRADFEFEMLRKGIDKKIPILGIGGGMQMVNVFFGGSMYQNISEEVPGVITHNQIEKGLKSHQLYHDNVIVPNTELARILGTDTLQVNSTHIQAVKKLGDGLKINAISKVDNIIEGIELDSQDNWIMGLQWHPEVICSKEEAPCDREQKLFETFLAKALENKEKK